MPSKNDYVNYGAQGICKIEDVRRERFDAATGERDYCVLKPVHQQNACIFVPVDNPKLLRQMRPILTPREIDQTIRSIRHQSLPWINDRRQRAAQFQEILARRDERELLLLASSLYWRSKEEGKGLSSGDEQVLRQVETIIEQEFSFSLHLGPRQIGPYILKTLEQPEEPS